MKPIKISLDDYILSGGGANGESYDHRTDPSVMLKLYFPGKIQQPLDEDTAIHSDLQFSNAIFAGDQRYFIDLGDFCWGNHLFDVGMVYLCCCLNGEDFIRETFHMSKSLAIRFWESFAPEYFGKGIPLKEIEALICPYAGLKTIIIERDMGKPMPEFREALRPILE